MNLIIRQEASEDHEAVFHVIKTAFETAPFSDHSEHFLVQRLRQSKAFIPELSLVAECDGEMVGHIILTRIEIVEGENRYPSLALAPVSVVPNYQGKGIGGQLIEAAHKIARKLGHGSVVLLGHADYYPRFGYQRCDQFGIRLPFEVPPENCMAVELSEDALEAVQGEVQYDPAFFAGM